MQSSGSQAAGWLRGNTVLEFGSPHGGTWIPLLTERGFTTVTSDADVVLDCFGIMHEPDQRAAFELRAQVTSPGRSAAAAVPLHRDDREHGQWNALRHGHFAYYSLTALTQLLDAVGLRVVTAWEFDLYGGTVLLAAVHGDGRARRVGAAHPRSRGRAGHHRARLPWSASKAAPIDTSNRCGAGSKHEAGGRAHGLRLRRGVTRGRPLQPRRNRFTITCGGRRRLARQARQADARYRYPHRVAG